MWVGFTRTVGIEQPDNGASDASVSVKQPHKVFADECAHSIDLSRNGRISFGMKIVLHRVHGCGEGVHQGSDATRFVGLENVDRSLHIDSSRRLRSGDTVGDRMNRSKAKDLPRSERANDIIDASWQRARPREPRASLPGPNAR